MARVWKPASKFPLSQNKRRIRYDYEFAGCISRAPRSWSGSSASVVHMKSFSRENHCSGIRKLQRRVVFVTTTAEKALRGLDVNLWCATGGPRRVPQAVHNAFCVSFEQTQRKRTTLITAKELATYPNVLPADLYRLIKSRQMPSIRWAGSRRMELERV